MAKQPYSLKLLIKEINAVNQASINSATNICEGFYKPKEEMIQSADIMQETTQVKFLQIT